MTADDDELHPDDVVVPDVLPVLPLRQLVVFPFVIVPLSIGREASAEALNQALADHRVVLLVPQKDPEEESPGAEDLMDHGTASLVMRMLKLPDGRMRVLVQGLARARIEHLTREEPFLEARIRRLETPGHQEEDMAIQALMRSVKESLEQVVHRGRGISSEVMMVAASLDDPGRLADLAASNLELKPEDAYQILQTIDPAHRLEAVHGLLTREIKLLGIQERISSRTQGEMDRNQREYYLRQQLKSIHEELGEGSLIEEEVRSYRDRIQGKSLPDEASRELETQLQRLGRSHPESAEATILRTYLDWLTGLPWGVTTEDDLDLASARKFLDADHYDLEKVKERILEYLAVRKLNPSTRGPILCFVGPPGVGKTSLGRSIARAMGRRFVRISLGGVRDEAEIRGHRRTYVGALPGRILQGIHQAGTCNPVFMIDEIDKIGRDGRGDPGAALLEVLDPEQNSSFTDHYLGLGFDLSKVFFITTANLLDPVEPAFLDRMEVLRLSGYTTEEKIHIVRRYLLPRQIREHGLRSRHIAFTEAAIRRIIRDYTKEAGLRNLERELAAICRKVAVEVAQGSTGRRSISIRNVGDLLGPAKHFSEEMLDRDRVGVATGLAWTATGGDLLLIEVLALPGSGKLVLTGQLGDVMRESAQAALSYARGHARRQGLDTTFFARHDLHVHAPAGSIPKDGPSAGITVAAAMVSVLTDRPLDRRVAMTGELTLRGAVLPIGGLKEKILAAREAGLERIVLPRLNERDLSEISEDLKQGLTFHLVEQMDEVPALALTGDSTG